MSNVNEYIEPGLPGEPDMEENGTPPEPTTTIWDDLKESVRQAPLVILVSLGYFLLTTLCFKWLFSCHWWWALLVADILFMVFVGIVRFGFGEHWETGKKKYAFLLIAIGMSVFLLFYAIFASAPDFAKEVPNFAEIFQQNSTRASSGHQAKADYRIYQPGTYGFSFKAGETTDHWIMFPAGRDNHYNLSSHDYGYHLIYDDGTVIRDGKNVVYPKKNRVRLKIQAITCQPVVRLNLQ